ncbi:MAG: UDP-N-acetylglucosamine 4,6-dehydratase (inverting) [Candidatus Anammoxibacter sp.]
MKNKATGNFLNNKTILITGGTGSFGKMFTQIAFSRYKLKKLIIFSRDEFKQYEMQQTFDHPDIRFFIGDVRDKSRLLRAFEGVDYVVHAAALKHVPTAEYNPFEVIKTNVIGAQNVIDVSIDTGVKKIVALSTDKAASPINLYGASKLCSDKLFISGNSYVGAKATRFCVVRYGNVIGSRGSVIPLFIKLRKTGTLPITDEKMTRFWITLKQGVEFVFKAFERMNGGELFVPKIPSTSISDIAKAIAPKCKIKIVGIRPGEKLHELLITKEDGRKTLEYPGYYVIGATAESWSSTKPIKNTGKPVKAGFEYSSDNNPMWLSFAKTKQLIDKYCRENDKDLLR